MEYVFLFHLVFSFFFFNVHIKLNRMSHHPQRMLQHFMELFLTFLHILTLLQF
uniref:Uncharacterized protein n=1 Tax=Rhizophora mucronata TaxID=61149 RepID=A0A2P2Q317_RHIMU